MYLIPIAKACDNREMCTSEDPTISCGQQVSKKLNVWERNQQNSNPRKSIACGGVCVGEDSHETTGPFTSRAISSQKYYNEQEWKTENNVARRQITPVELGRLEPYMQNSRRYSGLQKKIASMDSHKRVYQQHVGVSRRNRSSERMCHPYPHAKMHSSNTSRGQENSQERCEIKSSDKDQLTSSTKTLLPVRRGNARSTFSTWKEQSFINTTLQQRFRGSVRTGNPQWLKHSSVCEKSDPEVLPSEYSSEGSRIKQMAQWIEHTEMVEKNADTCNGEGWCSEFKRGANQSGSQKLPLKQRWTVNRFGHLKTSGRPQENTGSRISVERSSRKNLKKNRSWKLRRSWNGFQSDCRIETDRIKSRREYAVGSLPKTYRQNVPGTIRQREVTGDQWVRFRKNSGSKPMFSDEEDCTSSSKQAWRPQLHPVQATHGYDPVAARLRQRSVKLSNMNDSDSGTGSSDYEDDNQESTSESTTPDHKISIKLPTITRKEPANRPLATINDDDYNPDARCIQLDELIKIETTKHLGEVFMHDKENLHAAELKKATKYLITRKLTHKKEIPLTPHFRQTSVYHPCYIADNVGQVMSFLSLIDIMKAKRVSKIWEIAANSTLRRRIVDNLTINPPMTAEAGSMMLSQLHIFLPKLQCLTLNISNFKHLKGLVLSYICECKNLVFLRIENLAWRDLTIATQVILSLRDPGNHGHPILNMLEDLELPDSKLPIPTSTQCMRPLSKLAPNLRSLTVKSAQDPIIFSIRLFFPSVRNLFLLDTLWTTRRFAQIISSSPHLMKFLMDGQKVRMLTPMVTGGSGMQVSSPGSSSPSDRTSIPHTPRIHSMGSVPVTPSDDRLTPLISNHKESLYVEPLGRVKQIETGKDLTKANIGMFAGFCALIGVLIIMPPMDRQE